MANLKSNIFFNFLGSAWLGILTLAVTPIQVHLLGVEAFGFVGIITMMQVLLSSLDLGISATVTKVVSSDHSNQHNASARVVNTASSLYWAIAFLISILLWWNSENIGNIWLNRTSIEPDTAILGIKIIAVHLGLRWPVAFYTGVISGLQRMDILNMVRAGVHTLRLGGSVVVLLFATNLVSFLIWFAISSAIELLLYAGLTYRLFPPLRLLSNFSLGSFKDIWKYSATMNLIAITALVLSQADRLAVTKFLSLEALGYYTIAYNASIAISLIQSAINGASFPAFSHSFSRGDYADLQSRYNKASQLMGLVVALPCFALTFFGHDILELWINANVADEAALTMTLLAIGLFLNAMVSNAYIVAMACGQPGLPLKISLVALFWYLPAIYLLIHEWGMRGAAAAFVGLNIYYVIVFMPLVETKVMKHKATAGMKKWLHTNFFPFVLTGVVAFGAAKCFALLIPGDWKILPTLALGVLLYCILSWLFLSKSLRTDLCSIVKRTPHK